MFPAELTALPQWVVAARNKIPLNPRTLNSASVTDKRTWAPFDVAHAVATKHGLHLGFVFTAEDPFVGIDLDTPTDDIQRARHSKIFRHFDTYAETSLSGNGVHLIARGSIPHAVKRDHVEVYNKERYFIMTGNVLGARHTINDCQEMLDHLVAEMGGDALPPRTHSEPQREEDAAVLTRCADSANGDKFKALWLGAQNYSSQSEADFALINMLAFASPNNEQCKRLFRQSHLGQRNKALREDYLDRMLAQIRGEQYPPIDFTNFQPPTFQAVPDTSTSLDFPAGLVGDIAHYIYATAIRPIPQVALAGALGLVAGIAGRAYNISHTGLNLYLLLVAGTAIGKEGAAQGIDRLIQATMPRLPSIQQFMGPGEYASGQALIKQLHQFPCQLSVLGEFGHTLKRISRHDAIGADIMWRKVLLDIYNKSGATNVLGSMVYSDTGKNTPTVQSPALTLLAETSPASLYEGVDEHTVEIGLIPRFMLIECDNFRPPRNEQAFTAPSAELVARLEALGQRCLSMAANNTHVNIALAPEAQALLDAFDKEVDHYINAQNEDAIRQIWSRAHVKALRIAGIVTVGLQLDAPVVREHAATWAVNLARADAQNMLRRFGEGVGGGDSEQLARLRQVIRNTLEAPDSISRKMRELNVIPHRQIAQRAYALACYRQDRRGAGEALKRALQALVDCGELIMISPSDTREHFGTTAKCYQLTSNFGQ